MLLHRKNDSREASSRSVIRSSLGGRRFRAEDELRIRQDQTEALLDAGLESLAASRFVTGEHGTHVGLSHRTTIRAPRQRRQDGPGTGRFVDGALWTAAEHPAAARRVARTGRIEWSRHREVIDERQAVHVLKVVVALVRLQRLVRLGSVAAVERHPHHVRAGFDLDPRLQPLVDHVGGFGHVPIRREVVLLAAHLHQERAFAVDGDLELMRVLEPGHVADDVAEQKDVEVVLGVLREVVAEQHAAATAKRQPFDVILLRIVRRNAERIDDDFVLEADAPAH